MCMQRLDDALICSSSGGAYLFLKRQAHSLVWNSASRLGWMPRDPQQSSSTRTANTCHHPSLKMWVLTLNCGPSVCKAGSLSTELSLQFSGHFKKGTTNYFILLEVTYDYFSFVFFVVMLEPRTLHFLVKCSITKVYLSPFLNFKKFKTRAC